MPGLDRAHRASGARVGVLHGLRLVKHKRRPWHLLECLEIASGHLIRRDDEVVRSDAVGERYVVGAAGSVMNHHAHHRCKASGLGFPVAHHRQRTHHQVRTRQTCQVCERRRCLAKAHVVGQATAKPETMQKLQPTKAPQLIWAQGCGEPVGNGAIGECFIGKASEQLVCPTGRLDRTLD